MDSTEKQRPGTKNPKNPDEVEDSGPNRGDGNGDGIPDSSQPKVTTLPAANESGFISIESTCELRNVEAVPKRDFENTPLLFRHELVSFELPCSVATLMIYFHADETWSPGTGYWKYGPTTPGDPDTVKWYKLPGVRFDTTVVGGISVARAIFTLTDGQLGDDTEVDGNIVDAGGPADSSSRRRPVSRR